MPNFGLQLFSQFVFSSRLLASARSKDIDCGTGWFASRRRLTCAFVRLEMGEIDVNKVLVWKDNIVKYISFFKSTNLIGLASNSASVLIVWGCLPQQLQQHINHAWHLVVMLMVGRLGCVAFDLIREESQVTASKH